MNGARSIYMRGGYLLTALAAAVLLAASSGTALAQNTTGVAITGPSMNTVNEGGTATFTVAVRGYVDAATDQNSDDAIQPDEATAANTLTVTLAPPRSDMEPLATTGDGADLNGNAHVLSVTFNTPRNASAANSLLFTDSKTISVATLHDNDAEDEHFELTFSLSAGVGGLDTTADGDEPVALATTGTAANPNALIIDDDETQGYTLALTPGQTPTEGVLFTVDLTASPAHVNGSGTLQVNIDKQSGWILGIGDSDNVNPAIVVAPGDDASPAADSKVEISITQTAGDRNRVTDTVTVSAHTGVVGASLEKASLSLDVVDANALQAVTAMVVDADGVVLDPQPESVEEGKSVKIAVMPLDKDGKVTTANEALEIALTPSGSADARDYRLSAPIKITSSQNKSNVVDLMVETDEDVGMETLMFDATVSGDANEGTETRMVEGLLSLMITDATDKKIRPKSEDDAYPSITDPMEEAAGDDGLNPGESFMVVMDDLFTLMDGYTATYGADSEGSAVSISERGDVLTIEAEESGTSKVTVTGTASMAASSFAPSQTVSNVAYVAFEVMVVDTKLVVALAADPMEIEEGGTSTITAMANRAVVAGDGDVAINLSVVGDATLDPDSIMIAMGEMSGSAMLTAMEDDSDYEDETVTVVASGSGIDGQVSISVDVMDNDEAPVDPEPTNSIEAMPQDDAYPIITAAIDAGAGEDGFNLGESAMVDAAGLFTVMDGYTATYSADVEGDAASVSSSGSHVTVMADMVGEAKVTITGTATAASSSFEAGQPATNVATVAFPVMVVDAPPAPLEVTVTASASEIDEGDSVRLTATANRAVTADTELSVTVTGAVAAVSVADTITISSGATEGMTTVSAVEDDDTANADVTLVVSGPGIASPVSLSIAVTDNDRTVSALTQAEIDAVFGVAVATAAGGPMWLPDGNAATVDMSALFNIEASATVEYEAMSSADETVGASASGSMLTLTPEATGSATITVTATDSSGDADDTATASSMVTVGVLPLVVMLEMPDNVMEGNIVEGMDYKIKASANRAVDSDTEVMIMRDRAASDAGDADVTVTSAMIMAGETMGYADLMVTEDMEPDSGTNDNMGESLVLYGMVGDMETNSLTFTIWDHAVPALPLIGQLVLALFLTLGGARLYRRRRQGLIGS